MKKIASVVVAALMCATIVILAGCSSGSASSSSSSQTSSASASSSSASSSASASASASSAALADGTYSVDFKTDSSMFRVNEADNGKGVLTVKDGTMTVHIRLVSKKIVKLYAGTANQAESNPNNAIQPTTETVKYSDGTQEEVFAFDVPVPQIGQEFDLAILGEKGKWYDHKVSVANPVAQ